MKIINIKWETDGEDINLPTELELPNDIDETYFDAINDYLSDTTGFLVIDWEYESNS